MIAAKLEGFKLDVNTVIVHDDCVCFEMNLGIHQIDVELPTVATEYDVIVNRTNDPQNDVDMKTEGQEVAKITSTYGSYAIGKIIDHTEDVLVIENQPIWIDEQDVEEINQLLKEHAEDAFYGARYE